MRVLLGANSFAAVLQGRVQLVSLMLLPPSGSFDANLSDDQRLTLVGPFERLCHGFVEVGDEGLDLGLEVLG